MELYVIEVIKMDYTIVKLLDYSDDEVCGVRYTTIDTRTLHTFDALKIPYVAYSEKDMAKLIAEFDNHCLEVLRSGLKKLLRGEIGEITKEEQSYLSRNREQCLMAFLQEKFKRENEGKEVYISLDIPEILININAFD